MKKEKNLSVTQKYFDHSLLKAMFCDLEKKNCLVCCFDLMCVCVFFFSPVHCSSIFTFCVAISGV